MTRYFLFTEWDRHSIDEAVDAWGKLGVVFYYTPPAPDDLVPVLAKYDYEAMEKLDADLAYDFYLTYRDHFKCGDGLHMHEGGVVT